MFVRAPWRADWSGAVEIHRGGDVEYVDTPARNAYELQLDNFAAAVAGEARPLLGRADALGQTATIDALYRAAESGASVAL